MFKSIQVIKLGIFLAYTVIKRQKTDKDSQHYPASAENRGKQSMLNKIPVQIEETNQEVLARIIKATARKYNCNLVIDFSNGNRKVEFTGDEACKPLILEELKDILKYDKDANSLKLKK